VSKIVGLVNLSARSPGFKLFILVNKPKISCLSLDGNEQDLFETEK